MLRPLPYGANYLGWRETPELRQALDNKVLFRYSAPAPSNADQLESYAVERLGAARALAVPNGTQALRVALMGTRPRVGDPVYIPAVTFVAVAGAVLSCGLVPVPVDVDARFGLDASLLPEGAERVVVAHMEGLVAELPEHVPYIIEDTAQAMGGRHEDGRHAGTVGYAGTFSFHHAKILTSGEGGLVVVRDGADWDVLRSYTDHGSAREQGKYPAWNAGAFYGENLCANEAVTAVQLQQFRRLDEILDSLERHYALALETIAARPGITVAAKRSGDVKTSVRLVLDSRELRDLALNRLTEQGLPCWSLDKYLLPDHPVVAGRASLYADGFPWNLADGDDRYRPLSHDGFAATRDRLGRTLCIPLAPELDAEGQRLMAKQIATVLAAL
ncbi:DegT/DnrJ/EryC1/StrS family aminotransferase [Streptomyces sp. NPDC048416]|uniref:DegT/DnrJ/EryC1/StrS family aminotransferase n=1 Tax=Streptomyces sp. NPDC048416 TaxID=3365546 RepID=UPI00371D3D68